ncbi:unnamed protein product [Rhizoctonia solani]|uniref:Uncharacterized protein n=1 Tax=Rhizoctonia solani TaxID=456999 RepID=A0A8H3ABB2_9AGAM|nr:unnamed protein product [Rhizoctonia solani]
MGLGLLVLEISAPTITDVRFILWGRQTCTVLMLITSDLAMIEIFHRALG